jgi:hypothetical protein
MPDPLTFIDTLPLAFHIVGGFLMLVSIPMAAAVYFATWKP